MSQTFRRTTFCLYLFTHAPTLATEHPSLSEHARYISLPDSKYPYSSTRPFLFAFLYELGPAPSESRAVVATTGQPADTELEGRRRCSRGTGPDVSGTAEHSYDTSSGLAIGLAQRRCRTLQATSSTVATDLGLTAPAKVDFRDLPARTTDWIETTHSQKAMENEVTRQEGDHYYVATSSRLTKESLINVVTLALGEITSIDAMAPLLIDKDYGTDPADRPRRILPRAKHLRILEEQRIETAECGIPPNLDLSFTNRFNYTIFGNVERGVPINLAPTPVVPNDTPGPTNTWPGLPVRLPPFGLKASELRRWLLENEARPSVCPSSASDDNDGKDSGVVVYTTKNQQMQLEYLEYEKHSRVRRWILEIE
ncbi:hypothetical protein WAI453_004082 [Rhynchosporium graminicola]